MTEADPNVDAQRAPASTEATAGKAKATLASRGRRLLRHILLVVTAAIVVDAVAGEKGLLALLQARRDYRLLEESLAQAKAENQELRDYANQLRTDPRAIEIEARRQMGLIAPGETLFIIKDVERK